MPHACPGPPPDCLHLVVQATRQPMQTENSNALEDDCTFFLETMTTQRASRDPALTSAA